MDIERRESGAKGSLVQRELAKIFDFRLRDCAGECSINSAVLRRIR